MGDLKGQILTIVVADSWPYFKFKNELEELKPVTGIDVTILNILAQKLNFK